MTFSYSLGLRYDVRLRGTVAQTKAVPDRHSWRTGALLLMLFSLLAPAGSGATCESENFAIHHRNRTVFSVSRQNGTCVCTRFVAEDAIINGSSLVVTLEVLKAEISALNATTAALLLGSAGGGGSGGDLGAACANDTECVYPYVCSASSRRCLGSTGVGCTLDTQCAYGLGCQSGVCVLANLTCPPLHVDNGHLTYTDNGMVGSIAVVTCINGFSSVPTASPQTCQANGQWSGATTSCVNYNACATDPRICAPGHCTTTTGSYTCVCPSGWTGTGTQRCKLHNALRFNWTGGYVGGAGAHPGYNNANLVGCMQSPSYGWKECIQLASQYGGMLEPVNQSWLAWKSHREMLPPMGSEMVALCISSPQDTTYRTAPVTNLRLCSVCRDSRATQNNMTLAGFTTYDGQDWYYQDFGLMYYDECQLLAANAGAMVISPATIGITSTVQYHVNVVRVTDYAYYPSIGGNNGYAMEMKPLGARSAVRGCMVGYVDN